ncbi:hypothetical protein BH10PSE18_BH10PSE18_46590 [soil metagenome]
MNKFVIILALAASAVLSGCGQGADTAAASGTSPRPAMATANSAATARLSAIAQVGEKMFVDATLSGSGKMSCASCHDPKSAFGPPNDLSVQLGGADLQTQGTRAAPSLRYKDATPAYADLLDNPDGISVPGPGGGLAWDGRAPTLAEQARIPLLAANEMANASIANVVARLRDGSYADLFRQAFGKDAFADDDAAFADGLKALQAYQLEERDFHPYSSKFDLYAGNKIGGTLTPAEARGLKVFSNPAVGNCASCN